VGIVWPSVDEREEKESTAIPWLSKGNKDTD